MQDFSLPSLSICIYISFFFLFLITLFPFLKYAGSFSEACMPVDIPMLYNFHPTITTISFHEFQAFFIFHTMEACSSPLRRNSSRPPLNLQPTIRSFSNNTSTDKTFDDPS